MCFFFFSSRRRHTRYWRDWSSDVCSSDLQPHGVELVGNLSGFVEHDAVWLEHGVDVTGRPAGVVGQRHGRPPQDRSGERRVGEKGRFRWAPYHLKKKKKRMDVHRYMSSAE